MKRILLLLIFSVAFCTAQSQDIQFYKNSKGDKHIAGPFPIDYLKKDTLYSKWFNKSYNAFTMPSTDTSWKNNLKDMKVDIYLGTWCGDSKNWVPKFLKVWDTLGLNRDQLNFIAFYDGKEKYKQGPNGEEKGKRIHRVPTFIFKNENKEVARIVEYPRNDLVTDIAQIAVGFPSKPNYLGANYLMNYLEENSVEELYKDVNTHFQKIYRLIGKRKELNTLGYVYLRSGRETEALIAFEFNTYYFPTDPYVFDSFAEALEITGDTEKAIKMYEKVLELDSKNEKAAKKLAELKKEKK
jgi:tetratricopeptide (TPR) repeat protein